MEAGICIVRERNFQTKPSRMASVRKWVLSKDLKEMKQSVIKELFKQREQEDEMLIWYSRVSIKSSHHEVSGDHAANAIYDPRALSCFCILVFWNPLGEEYLLRSELWYIHAFKKHCWVLNSNTAISIIYHLVVS